MSHYSNLNRESLSKSIARIFFAGLTFVFVLLFASLSAYSQDTAKTAKPFVIPDSIVSVINPRTLHDSAKINEVIAIKVFTNGSLDSLRTLYVDGLKLTRLNNWKIENDEKVLYFQLNVAVQDSLSKFLQSSPFTRSVMPVYFSVGTDKRPILKAKKVVYVEVGHTVNKYWIYFIGIVIMVIAGIALYKNILKDDNNLYYSLGRTQLFYWTLLVIAAYLIICLKTDVLPDLPPTILAILGISVSTMALTKVVENRAKGGTIIDTNAKSEGWFYDILSDGSSINIQRFQNVAFNVFFGVIFLQRTFSTHLMPDFDENNLLLLGISSGAYAGLKLTEASKEQNQPPKQVVEDAVDAAAAAQQPAAANVVPATPVADPAPADAVPTATAAGEDAS